MSLPTSLAAYEDCFVLYDRALADPVGTRSMFANYGLASIFRMRMHTARALSRRETERMYEPTDPQFGKSEYDCLRVSIRKATDDDLPDAYWVYVDRHGTEVIATESLSEEPAP